MFVAHIQHGALEIGSGAPWARMRPAGAVLHRLARLQTPQPDITCLSADAEALAKRRHVRTLKPRQTAEFQTLIHN